MQNDLTRPIIGIENRTAQEVFNIMCDRFRHLSATVPAGDGELVDAFENHQWPIGLRVTKTKGAAWTGRIVGYYTTELTPVGYAVESENEPGSVQIYPVAALSRAD